MLSDNEHDSAIKKNASLHDNSRLNKIEPKRAPSKAFMDVSLSESHYLCPKKPSNNKEDVKQTTERNIATNFSLFDKGNSSLSNLSPKGDPISLNLKRKIDERIATLNERTNGSFQNLYDKAKPNKDEKEDSSNGYFITTLTSKNQIGSPLISESPASMRPVPPSYDPQIGGSATIEQTLKTKPRKGTYRSKFLLVPLSHPKLKVKKNPSGISHAQITGVGMRQDRSLTLEPIDMYKEQRNNPLSLQLMKSISPDHRRPDGQQGSHRLNK